jgi:hypothetical protein
MLLCNARNSLSHYHASYNPNQHIHTDRKFIKRPLRPGYFENKQLCNGAFIYNELLEWCMIMCCLPNLTYYKLFPMTITNTA